MPDSFVAEDVDSFTPDSFTPDQEGDGFSLLKGIRQMGVGFAGGESGGLTDILANKAGVPQSPLRDIAGVVGMMAGGLPAQAGKLGGRAVLKMAPRAMESVGGRMIVRGAEGAIGAGASQLGNAIEERSPAPILQAAGMGGAVGAAIPPAGALLKWTGQGVKGIGRGIASIPKTGGKGMVKFAEGVRTEFERLHEKAGLAFEDDVARLTQANPNKPVDIRQAIDMVNTRRGADPIYARMVDSAIKRAEGMGDTTLAEFLNNPDLATKATLQQANQARITLKQAPGLNRKLMRSAPEFRDAEIDLLDAANEVKASQLYEFPDFQKTIDNFRETAQKIRQVKGMFSPARLEPSIKRGFGTAEQEATVESLLPPETMKSIRNVRTGNKIKTVGGIAAGGAVGTGTLAEIAKRVFTR